MKTKKAFHAFVIITTHSFMVQANGMLQQVARSKKNGRSLPQTRWRGINKMCSGYCNHEPCLLIQQHPDWQPLLQQLFPQFVRFCRQQLHHSTKRGHQLTWIVSSGMSAQDG